MKTRNDSSGGFGMLEELSTELKRTLVKMADQYETTEFIQFDPISFVRDTANVGNRQDVEVSAFISSWLAFGSRTMIYMALRKLHREMEYKPFQYLQSHQWKRYENDSQTLHRFFTYHDFYCLMERLEVLYEKDAFSWRDSLSRNYPLTYLIACFQGVKGFPKNDTSACKRLNMLLRWMVRQNSVVDLGIWDQINPAILYLPLDTHSHRVAIELGLTDKKFPSMNVVTEITEKLAQAFPGDPARGDFALFGFGVNHKSK